MKRIVSGLLLLALLSGCTSAAMQKTPEDSGRDAPLTVVQESMPEDLQSGSHGGMIPTERVSWTRRRVCCKEILSPRGPPLWSFDRIQRFCRSCMRLFVRMDSWIFGGQ